MGTSEWCDINVSNIYNIQLLNNLYKCWNDEFQWLVVLDQ